MLNYRYFTRKLLDVKGIIIIVRLALMAPGKLWKPTGGKVHLIFLNRPTTIPRLARDLEPPAGGLAGNVFPELLG
jgi:hypothetical protein